MATPYAMPLPTPPADDDDDELYAGAAPLPPPPAADDGEYDDGEYDEFADTPPPLPMPPPSDAFDDDDYNDDDYAAGAPPPLPMPPPADAYDDDDDADFDASAMPSLPQAPSDDGEFDPSMMPALPQVPPQQPAEEEFDSSNMALPPIPTAAKTPGAPAPRRPTMPQRPRPAGAGPAPVASTPVVNIIDEAETPLPYYHGEYASLPVYPEPICTLQPAVPVPDRPDTIVPEFEAAAATFHQESLRSLIVAENEFNKKMRALVQIVTQVTDAADMELPHRGKESVIELFKDIAPLQQAHYTLLQRMSKRLKSWTTQPWLGDLYLIAVPSFTLCYRSYNDSIYKINEIVKEDRRFKAIIDRVSANAIEPFAKLLLAPIREQLPIYGQKMKAILAQLEESHRDHLYFNLALQQLIILYRQLALRKLRIQQQTFEQELFNIVFTREIFLKGDSVMKKEKKGLAGKFGKIKTLLSTADRLMLIVSEGQLTIQADSGRSKVWPLNLVWMKDIEQQDMSDPKNPETFELVCPCASYILKFPNADEKCTVMEAINAAWRKTLNPDNAPDKGKRFGMFRVPHQGIEYEGWWLNGAMNGQGLYKDEKRNLYLGEWVDNVKQGVGVFTCAYGRYSGQWKDDQPEGFGYFEYTTKSAYLGEWRDGLRSGMGKWTSASGTIEYEGQWDRQLPSGSGIYRSPLVYYTGGWLQGRPNGQGMLISAFGTYTGEFAFGRRSGEGKLLFPNGDYYDGQWKNDLRHGQGTLCSRAEGIFVGQWQADQMVEGKMSYHDGNCYEGSWKQSLFHGQGIFTTATGPVVRYDGTWQAGKLHGKATVIYRDGSTFEGTFKDDKAHGTCLVRNTNGTAYEGKWVDGRREGKFTIRKGDIAYSSSVANSIMSVTASFAPNVDLFSTLIPPETPIIRLEI